MQKMIGAAGGGLDLARFGAIRLLKIPKAKLLLGNLKGNLFAFIITNASLIFK